MPGFSPSLKPQRKISRNGIGSSGALTTLKTITLRIAPDEKLEPSTKSTYSTSKSILMSYINNEKKSLTSPASSFKFQIQKSLLNETKRKQN